jgi:hypothetical protein
VDVQNALILYKQEPVLREVLDLKETKVLKEKLDLLDQ